ncbi:MAG: penicillin acylase family protein [Burkholderiales bacterium]
MRLLLRTGLLLLVVLAVALAAAYAYLRQSLPKLEGELRVPGLVSGVDVLRDAWGIPHIYARNAEDAYFALGYVHAQDRLWQMEMNRRIAAGRIAEVVGPRGLEADRFLRTLGVRRAAEATLANLDADTRVLLDVYAAGVNAFLAGSPVLPVEFLLTGTRPEPWTPADSLGWVKMMAWDLGGNWRNELLRMRLASALPMARIHEFLPPYPGDAPPRIADLRELYGGLGKTAVKLAAMAPPAGEGLGSNSWVLSGAHTASGKPLLANDPHLGLTAPAVWYLAHLHAPGLNVIGATLPGVPLVVLGRNARIAWGFTNTGPDVQDIYIEKLDSAGGYLAPDGPQPFSVIEETIRVKGAPAETLQVRATRHGPVISDVFKPALDAAPRGYVLAFQWTALRDDDLSLQALAKLARARNWDDAVGASREMHTPQQNIVYADVDGNIGFLAPGRIPLRRQDNDLMGHAPAPGWDARYDWNGFLDPAALPLEYNPHGGVIVTANHKIVPPGYPHFITSEWQPPYRAERIRALLAATPKHTLQSFARIQSDVASLAMREMLPLLLAAQPASDAARRAHALLAQWNGSMEGARAEPLIASAWWRELTRAVYADELGEAFSTNWLLRPQFMSAVLAARGDAARWCDDVRSAPVETCAQLLQSSLDAALADLTRRYGADMAAWRWDAAHVARHEHRPFGRHAQLAQLFNISVPTPGDAFSVNVGRNNLNEEANPYASRHAASLRAIYDLADLEQSVFIHSGGQSGNLLSPHYRSFTAAWAKGEYIPMRTARGSVEAASHYALRLIPQRK